MTVAITEVGRRGRFDVRFAFRGGRTVIRDSYCEVPFKITRLHPSEDPGMEHLILMHSTAGLFGGDHLECTIHVERGARVRITQQSATKIHPSGERPGGRPAIQHLRICVESGAELVIDCEPVIPFADSHYIQTTQLEVESGARLVFWECLMAGRIGRGELWQFAELSSETRLEMNGLPLYLDRFLLNPTRRNLTSNWIMKNANYVGTGLCFGDGASRIAELLHESLPEAGVDVLEQNLVAMRVAAASGPDFHDARQLFRYWTQTLSLR